PAPRGTSASPDTMQGSAVYELVFGEPVESPPGHRELLPVLWDLDILPEVRVLPLPMRQTWAWPAPAHARADGGLGAVHGAAPGPGGCSGGAQAHRGPFRRGVRSRCHGLWASLGRHRARAA